MNNIFNRLQELQHDIKPKQHKERLRSRSQLDNIYEHLSSVYKKAYDRSEKGVIDIRLEDKSILDDILSILITQNYKITPIKEKRN